MAVTADNFQDNREVDADYIKTQLDMKSPGDIALKGQFADSKCFFRGVMKPGPGKSTSSVWNLHTRWYPSYADFQGCSWTMSGHLEKRPDGSSVSDQLSRHVADLEKLTEDLFYNKISENEFQKNNCI